MMFGREVSFSGRTSGAAGQPILSLERVCLEGVRLQIQDVSLEARAGEVIGLAGMEGSGQSIFLSACAGLIRPVAGRIGLGSRDVTGQSHHSFKKQGVVYLPAARLERGLVPGLTLMEHFVLSEGSAGFSLTAARRSAWLPNESRPSTSRGLPRAPWNRFPAATSKGCSLPSCARRCP